MTEKQIVRIVKRQIEMGTQFLQIKMELHANEDPAFLSDLSDIFDIRLWKMTEFENEFEGMLTAMKDKLTKEDSILFYEDLNKNKVMIEFDGVMRAIYGQHEDEKILIEVRKKNHIIDQWVYIIERFPLIDEIRFPRWIRLVKRASAAPNGQTGTERSNSAYAMAKTKLQCSQSDEITRCRVRVQENGPPLSMFKPKPVRDLWLKYGHKLNMPRRRKRRRSRWWSNDGALTTVRIINRRYFSEHNYLLLITDDYEYCCAGNIITQWEVSIISRVS